jgi:hypothetical protein
VGFRVVDPSQWDWITRPHEPGAKGRRHCHKTQEETSVNHGDEDLLVYAYGCPPEDEHAELLEPAV